MKIENIYKNGKEVAFSELIGEVLTNIEVTKITHNGYYDDRDTDAIIFTGEENIYVLMHIQDCCEQVYIESIVGDLNDLLFQPILIANLSTQEGGDLDVDESYTWSFYKLATINGSVDIRWNGESNGYYSESVDFYKLPKGTKLEE